MAAHDPNRNLKATLYSLRNPTRFELKRYAFDMRNCPVIQGTNHAKKGIARCNLLAEGLKSGPCFLMRTIILVTADLKRQARQQGMKGRKAHVHNVPERRIILTVNARTEEVEEGRD